MSAQVCEHLTDDQISGFKEAFALFDKDGDGAGLFAVLAAAKLARDESRTCPETDPDEQLREAFRVMDKDGNGFISKEELRDVMSSLGVNLTPKEQDEMIAEADKDGDLQISFAEFKHIMLAK
eukprot:evm.model.scf_1938.4 EVM.evm.TU.scf_1938.4   scf_1938:23383-25204(-)